MHLYLSSLSLHLSFVLNLVIWLVYPTSSPNAVFPCYFFLQLHVFQVSQYVLVSLFLSHGRKRLPDAYIKYSVYGWSSCVSFSLQCRFISKQSLRFVMSVVTTFLLHLVSFLNVLKLSRHRMRIHYKNLNLTLLVWVEMCWFVSTNSRPIYLLPSFLFFLLLLLFLLGKKGGGGGGERRREEWGSRCSKSLIMLIA